MSGDEQVEFTPAPRPRVRGPARWVGLFADRDETRSHGNRRHGQVQAKHAKSDRVFFLAYARADLRVVKPLIESALEDGHAFWIDPGGVGPEAADGAEIARAARRCVALVAFCSRHSMASPEFLRQVAMASRQNKPILPVMLDEAPAPDTLLYHVSLRQMLHASDPDWRYEFNCALDALAPPEEEPDRPAAKAKLGATFKHAAVNAGLMACTVALAVLLLNVLDGGPTHAEAGAAASVAHSIEASY